MTDHPVPDPARYRVDQELIAGLRVLYHVPVPEHVIQTAKDLVPAEPAIAEVPPTSGVSAAD